VRQNQIILAITLLAGVCDGFSQGFVNLNFENATITTVSFSFGNEYVATVPGWTWSPSVNPVNGDTNSVPFNSFALDANEVTLQGTNSPFGIYPAIQGKYSILLQGGSSADPDTNGASIMQNGKIPATAKSITYWGDALQASFNGQSLAFSAIGSGSGYTIWQGDISAYAGETGQLEFTAPWQTSGMLDNIQFSTTPVPEPSTLVLSALGGLLLGLRGWKNHRQNFS